MELDKIEKIIKMFENAKINSLNIEIGEIKISLSKDNNLTNINHVSSEHIEEDKILNNKKLECANGEWVTSPLVGVFYESRNPEAEPFVKVGDKVNKGDVLCIIEAMKVMNEIRSNKEGIVKEIKPKNKDVVDYGCNLILIGDTND